MFLIFEMSKWGVGLGFLISLLLRKFSFWKIVLVRIISKMNLIPLQKMLEIENVWVLPFSSRMYFFLLRARKKMALM